MPGNFFNTNALLYLVSGDPAKADRAEKLVADGGMISVQVLNEIANVARRKMGLSWTETHAFLPTVRALLPVQPVTIDIHETGLLLAERYGLSTWDAMIAFGFDWPSSTHRRFARKTFQIPATFFYGDSLSP